MSTQQYSRDRGNLFDNAEKKKPSQPDLCGKCAIGGTAYDLSAWRRDEQLSLSLAPVRDRKKKNSYPPEAFRGALDPAPRAKGGGEAPAWVGDVTGDELTYAVRAFEKEGKSGQYLSLYFVVADAESEAQPDAQA